VAGLKSEDVEVRGGIDAASEAWVVEAATAYPLDAKGVR
jgi:hypothetical protein